MSRTLILMIIVTTMVSCQQGTTVSNPDQTEAVYDTVTPAESGVFPIRRDTVEFDRLLKQYYQALPDVGDTAIWGTWEESQNSPVSRISWQELPSALNLPLPLDSKGLPAPINYVEPDEDSAFYLPTADYWVRCNTADQRPETELHNFYFYQGYLNKLQTYFFAGCSVRIGGACDYYILDSLTSAVRVVRCEFDNPYRYVAWSERDSVLMLVANDGFSSTGMSVKLLRIKQRDSSLVFDHLEEELYPDINASDLRLWQAGGFAVRIVKKRGNGDAEETVWRRVMVE